MQHLYLMRGPQGSGKSTFLRTNNLRPWALSFDELRLMYGSLAMDSNGLMGTNQANDQRMFHRFSEMLEFRMSMGETTFVDATHMDNDFENYELLAKKWAYQVKIIDFGTDISPEVLMQRIEERSRNAPENFVPEAAMLRTLAKLKERTQPDHFEVLSPQDFVLQLNTPTPDWSGQYRDVFFVGDIQGCASVLRQLLDKHWRDDRLFIFVGDLFDRGPENGEVMTIMLELLSKPNVRLICGNHERHLLTWRNRGDTPTEFWQRTLPQLMRAGFNTEIAERFINRWDNLLQFQFGEALFQVNHGGASNVIERPLLYSGFQCWKGTGFYEQDVDQTFERNAPAVWHQVHGHRNAVNRDLLPTQRSFNLEANVEHGGALRALRFDGERFHTHEINNKVFIAMPNRDLKHAQLVPEWIKVMQLDKLSDHEVLMKTQISAQQLDELRHHELIRESVQATLPHVSSFNFTREAFYSQSYDSCNMRARGLYINTDTREVVIRGYDKYFNVNERGIPQAQLSHLLEVSKPPYRSTIKENGYLGLIGYDSTTDSLVYASKSTISGDHAQWLRDQVEARLNNTERQQLKCLLRDAQLSLTFEVIEPELDPHIIEYAEPKIILLDGIRRTLDFEKLGYEEVQKVAKMFNFDCKELGPVLPNKMALGGFLSATSKKGFTHHGQEVEGLVLEDSNGLMFKMKLPYYNLWKLARGAAMAVARFHEKGAPVKPHFRQDPVVNQFVDWLLTKEPSMAKQDIISLRNAFLEEHPIHEKAVSQHFQFDHTPTP
jgi:predicted kinase